LNRTRKTADSTRNLSLEAFIDLRVERGPAQIVLLTEKLEESVQK
jgi:hypothetical protein